MLLNFEPKNLEDVNAAIKKMEPDIMEIVLRPTEDAQEILDDIAAKAWDMSSLSMQELNLAYHMADLCDAKRKRQLMAVFGERVNELMFDIGWLYCQIHPNNMQAAELFEIACMWLGSKNPERYENHIMGVLNTEWKNIYTAVIEQMQKEELSLAKFAQKYGILTDSLFFKQLQCMILTSADANALAASQELLAELISRSDVPARIIKPLVESYIEKISVEKIPKKMLEVLMERVAAEGSDDSIGVPKTVIDAWRKEKFSVALEAVVNYDDAKREIYRDLIDRLRDIKQYEAEQIVMLDFGNYCVIDSPNWASTAYAYNHRSYEKVMGDWESGGRKPGFWPGVPDDQVASARDVQLGIKPGKIIELKFGGFDGLYTEELLHSGK